MINSIVTETENKLMPTNLIPIPTFNLFASRDIDIWYEEISKMKLRTNSPAETQNWVDRVLNTFPPSKAQLITFLRMVTEETGHQVQ